MRGIIIKTNNPEREKWVGTYGEILLNNNFGTDKIIQMHIENDNPLNDRFLTFTDAKKITIETKNSICEIEVL